MAVHYENQPMRPLGPPEHVRLQYEDTNHLLTDSTDYQPGRSQLKPLSFLRPTRWEAVLRAFGLGIIYTTIKGQNEEYPKVALWRSRSVALSKLLLHLIPLSAGVFLIWMNIYGYWLGTEVPGIQGYNSAKLGALQFAAKLHEITMLASLSMIIFTFVQRRIVAEQIAFGAVFAGLQYRNVDYLWSKELWGMIGSEWRRPYGKLFILVLILATWLAPTVGPSSGVLMVPKIDDWPAGGTDFWLNTTRDKLWPSEVTDHGVNPGCLFDKGQSDCPFSGWKAFQAGIFPMFHHLTIPPHEPYAWVEFPYSTRVPGKYAFRSINILNSVSFPLTVTSGLTSALADALSIAAQFWAEVPPCPPIRKHFNRGTSAAWSISKLQQPVTTVACRTRSLSIREGDAIYFPKLEHSPNDKPVPLSECFNVSNSQSLARAIKNISGTHPDLLWFPLADHNRNHSLGAIVTVPPSPTRNGTLFSCTLDAHWVNTSYSIFHRQQHDLTWAAETHLNSTTPETNRMMTLPRIRLSPRWASYLNPRIPNTNQSAIETLITAAGFWPMEPTNKRTRDLTSAVELSLSMMVSNGLSNLISNVEIQGRRPAPRGCDPAWIDPLMPQKQAKGRGELGHGGMLWNMSGIDTTNMTKFTMSVTVKGYAYSLGGATSIAAIIVLLIYCLLVVAHTVYVCFNSRSSSSWESISEIVALAMQSRATQYLRNTGPGISTKEIFRSPVQIRNVGQRAQLTFLDTRSGSTPITENKAYG